MFKKIAIAFHPKMAIVIIPKTFFSTLGLGFIVYLVAPDLFLPLYGGLLMLAYFGWGIVNILGMYSNPDAIQEPDDLTIKELWDDFSD